MTEIDLAQRAADILQKNIYANIATSGVDGPWNTPATALADAELNFYWSSWVNAVHSKNVIGNGLAFLTFFDSTRARGTNNKMCLYLRCEAREVTDPAEAAKAAELLYPDEQVDLSMFLAGGIKRFYRATPTTAWLNSLSERELEPGTLKMRVEVPLDDINRSRR